MEKPVPRQNFFTIFVHDIFTTLFECLFTNVFEVVVDADGERMLAGSQCRHAKVVVFDRSIANSGARRSQDPVAAIQAVLRTVDCGSAIACRERDRIPSVHFAGGQANSQILDHRW